MVPCGMCQEGCAQSSAGCAAGGAHTRNGCKDGNAGMHPGGCTKPAPPLPPLPPGASLCDAAGWRRTFADEFDAATLDSASWGTDMGWDTRSSLRDAKNVAANAFLDGGALVLRSRREQAPPYTEGIPLQLYGNTSFNYTSAAVTTNGKRAFGGNGTTTRVCVRAKLPGGGGGGRGTGYWPAHWLLPTGCPAGCSQGSTGCSAAEIDILEMVNGDGQAHATYHSQPNCSAHPHDMHDGASAAVGDFSTEFHEYAVQFGPSEATFFVDGQVVLDVPQCATPNKPAHNSCGGTFFDVGYHLLLNTAIGGPWPLPPTVATAFPGEHRIDYVRASTQEQEQEQEQDDAVVYPAATPHAAIDGRLTEAAAVLEAAAAVSVGGEDHHVELTSGGLTRKAVVHLPPAASRTGSRALPLVLNFHALAADPLAQKLLTGFDTLADAEGFVVAYPQGYSDARIWTPLPSPVGYSFNAGGCCPDACDRRIDDVGFARDLVAYVAGVLAADFGFAVDASRVYATGMSNGGFMSHRVGCEMADLVAAVAPVSGVLMNGTAATWGSDPFACAPAGGARVPVLHIHGDADPVVPYNGSALLGFPSVDASLAAWRAVNGVPPAARPTVTYARGRTSCSSWGQAGTSSNLTLCTVGGGGHSWPSSPDACPGGSGPFACSRDIDATAQIWDFFKRYSLGSAGSSAAVA